jgi:cytochrome bd-type quinol oxidase subunit 2
MHALRLPKHLAGAAFLIASTFVAVGVWVFFHTPGKNGFDSIPLFWLFAVVSAPILSLACVVVMWRQRASAWLAGFATVLLLPQAVVWFFAVMGVLHYLELVR